MDLKDIINYLLNDNNIKEIKKQVTSGNEKNLLQLNLV